MSEEALKEIWSILGSLNIKLTNEEKAVARYLLKARAARREQKEEKMNNKLTKKETKKND